MKKIFRNSSLILNSSVLQFVPSKEQLGDDDDDDDVDDVEWNKNGIKNLILNNSEVFDDKIKMEKFMAK